MANEDDVSDRVIDVGQLDLDRYDFPGLRADIEQIIDLPDAVGLLARRSLLILGVGTMATWIVFDPRMPRLVLIPYTLLVLLALAIAAVAIAVLIVLRQRMAQTDAAADRALFTIAALHGDYLRVRSGDVSVPMQEVASLLTREVVFPILIGGSTTMVETATATSGPMGWVLRPFIGQAMGMVERRVLVALDSVDPTAGDGAEEAQNVDDPAAAANGNLQDGPDPALVELWAGIYDAGLPADIQRWYLALHRHLSRVVDGVGVVAVGGVGATSAIAALPVVLLWVLGWVLT